MATRPSPLLGLFPPWPPESPWVPDLVENSSYEPWVDVPRRHAGLVVVNLEQRALDRLCTLLARQVCNIEIVTVYVVDAALEEVPEPGVRVLADGDYEIRGKLYALIARAISSATRCGGFSLAQ